ALAPRRAVLRGWKAAAYLACDQAQTLDNLVQLSDVQRDGVSKEEVLAFLDRCVHHQLMVHDERRWLGVAVHKPAREEEGLPYRGRDKIPLVSRSASS